MLKCDYFFGNCSCDEAGENKAVLGQPVCCARSSLLLFLTVDAAIRGLYVGSCPPFSSPLGGRLRQKLLLVALRSRGRPKH